jgi:hypothetical protein
MSNCTMQLVAALVEEYANVGGDLVTFGDDDRHLVTQFEIPGVNSGPHLSHRGLYLCRRPLSGAAQPVFSALRALAEVARHGEEP